MTISTSYNSNSIRPIDAQGTPIKPVRSTKQAISNVNAIVGWSLFGVGIIVFAISLLVTHSAAILALVITGGSLALSGIIELIISTAFRRSARREESKLERLKTEGQSFAGEITSIKRHSGAQFGRSFSVYAECTYTNNEGKTCLVKSPPFLHATDVFHRLHSSIADHGQYSASVYVNPYDPTDYAVEIYTQPIEIQGVYDYR